MEEGLIWVTPDKEKAKSMLKMVDTTLELIRSIDKNKFASIVVKDYYDAARELISAALLLDGFKTYGEGAHKKLIEYLRASHKQFSEYEINMLEELRITRNKVAYDGFFVTPDYVERNHQNFEALIAKLKELVKAKLKLGQ